MGSDNWTLDWSRSFDTNTALASMFMWLLFGMLSHLVNCDIQRMIVGKPLVMHLVSLVAFFFLFTMMDPSNKANLFTTWVKTLIVYVLFVSTTKSKACFVLPILALLLVDQSLKKHVEFQGASNDFQQATAKTVETTATATAETASNIQTVRRWLLVVIVILVIAGAIDYMRVQRIQHKHRFSWATFVLGTGKPCKEP
jgi:hypothetical protein